MTLPSHKQLILPVMQAVEDLGGKASPRDVVEAVADYLELPDAVRHYRGTVSGREVNLFARRVRWVRQDAIRRGFLEAASYGIWQLTNPGQNYLKRIRPGFVVTIYETDRGVALWAEAESAAAVISDSSINLIITSPEYPLLKPKDYGNRTGQRYLDWLSELATEWRRLLVDDGSLVVNVGDVWERGQPTQSLYQERLLLKLVDEVGLHLAQRFYYHNPSKIPSSEWVTIRRVRVRNVMENVWWLSKTANPKADNRKVLLPYTDRMKKLIDKGGEYRRERPAGHGATQGAFGRDNGGSIPTNVITGTNAASSDYYHRQCREHNLPAHPAMFAEAVPEFFIEMLTDPGDLVYDPLSGSNKVGALCERLGRRWISSERNLDYVSGSKFHVRDYENVAPRFAMPRKTHSPPPGIPPIQPATAAAVAAPRGPGT
jgi:site-specific DNA-methyltransferase (cytosine-N4-specific)